MTRWSSPKSYAPDPHEMLRKAGYRLTFGEKLVLWFRLNGQRLTKWFAMFTIALLVGAVVAAFVRAV